MRQELFHHANRPAHIDFTLSSDVFEASSFVVNIDLPHDAGVVDQNVELGKLFGHLFVKSDDRFRIGNVASKCVKSWKSRFRTVHLSLIAARDKNRVTKCRELVGEFVTDAAATACDQNRIAREFHNSSASITSASLPSSFFMVPILTGCSLICVSQGPDPVLNPLCLHPHPLGVVGAERTGRHTLKGGEEMDRQSS